MTRRGLSRSNSTSSTLSCITVANDARHDQQPAQSSTPPTSVTDGASTSSSNTLKTTRPSGEFGRARRAKSGVTSYNENALAGSAHQRPKKRNSLCRRCVSGATVVPDSEDAQRRVMQNSARASGMDCNLASVPRNNESQQPGTEDGGSNGRSLRSQFLDTAAAAVSRTRSVIGKRSHDALEAGRETLESIGRRASLRPRDRLTATEPSKEEPTPKRVRLTEGKAVKLPAQEAIRASSKRYLAQG
ncbi:MAG: hypothetical protein MMC23_009872, partial [Stictis urceolatum]|nr:hypothetical protein [Stictis urceolata]